MLLDMAAEGFGDRVVVGSRNGGLTAARLRELAAGGATAVQEAGADALALVLKEVAVLPAVYYSRADFADAAELLGRHPDLPVRLVTHRFGLEDAATAFAVVGDRAAGAIKVPLLP